MDELNFLLILAGIGIVILIAMYSYYQHHKKIRDEIEDFNQKANTFDDVLLSQSSLDNSHESDKSHEPDKSYEAVNSHEQDNSYQSENNVEITSEVGEVGIVAQNNDLIEQELPDSFSASKDEPINIDAVNLMDERSFINASHQNTQVEMNLNSQEQGLVDGVYLHTKRIIANPNPNPQRNPLKSYAKTTQTFASHKKKSQLTQSIKMVYDPLPENVEELIISHSIVAKGEHFNGEKLYKAIENAGLLHGEMDIFHYPGDKKTETFSLFSLANLVEPGTFNLSEAATFSSPGISLFMRLPSRIDNNDAYDKFLKVAIIIATDLDGELCDETRSRLTQQAVTHKKGLIKKLNFELMKAEKIAQ